jgi:hypothetical protein
MSEIYSKMLTELHVKYSFLSYFNETGVFTIDFRKILISNFMEARVVGSEFHVDGRTDRRAGMTKVIVGLRNFAKAPKNWFSFSAECGKDTWNEPHRKFLLSVITRNGLK